MALCGITAPALGSVEGTLPRAQAVGLPEDLTVSLRGQKLLRLPQQDDLGPSPALHC